MTLLQGRVRWQSSQVTANSSRQDSVRCPSPDGVADDRPQWAGPTKSRRLMAERNSWSRGHLHHLSSHYGSD